MFDTARQYRESLDVSGSKKSFEWTLIEDEEHISVSDCARRVPKQFQLFTSTIQDAEPLSFIQSAGQGSAIVQLPAFTLPN